MSVKVSPSEFDSSLTATGEVFVCYNLFFRVANLQIIHFGLSVNNATRTRLFSLDYVFNALKIALINKVYESF